MKYIYRIMFLGLLVFAILSLESIAHEWTAPKKVPKLANPSSITRLLLLGESKSTIIIAPIATARHSKDLRQKMPVPQRTYLTSNEV